MAWIKWIDEGQAGELLRRAYAAVGATRGRVANILKIHSVHPEVMVAHLTMYRELMFARSELSRTERELLALTVSVVNRCHY